MRKFKTEKRLSKIERVVKQRQHSLNVVIENVYDPHNVSAIFRTCDAVGVPEVSLLYTVEQFPSISKVTSSSAVKWVNQKRYSNTEECFDALRKKGFKIYASLLSEDAKNLYDIDFTQKAAIVLGNESRGISEEVAELADECFYIPMRGMIQSLNVSVAAAVTLYEAQRQRTVNKMYENPELPKNQLEEIIDQWCEK